MTGNNLMNHQTGGAVAGFLTDIGRWILTALGGVVAILEPTLPYILICTLAILYDCYSAWSLSRRAHRLHPDRASKEAGKFKSHYFGKVLTTLLKAYALIVLAFLIERHIIDVSLTKVAAGGICFWQLWSILENESSCNGARWAKMLQRILVDKTSRHFDIDLNDLKTDKENRL